MEKIIKNESEGYGYSYASLSDIAKQGHEIPKMKTDTDANGNEYVYYFDGNEWQRGARVVIPSNKGMNEAQLYGSALTYARRYTTLMALQLVCDDDKELETSNEVATESQINYLIKLYTQEEIDKMVDYYKLASINELPKQVASQYISNRKQ